MKEYSTKEAADILGITTQTVRTHTKDRRFRAYLSDLATGRPRTITSEDLRVLAFISECSSVGMKLDEVASRLGAGALDEFRFNPPREDYQPLSSAGGAVLLPPEALGLILDQARERERDLRSELEGERQNLRDERKYSRQLNQELRELERKVGELEGRLASMRGRS